MEDEQQTEYELTPGERGVMQAMNMAALNVKAKLCDLYEAVDAAKAELTNAQVKFAGALQILANTHGMSNAVMTPDFAKITAQ